MRVANSRACPTRSRSGASKARFFADGELVLLQARPSMDAEIYDRPLKELNGPASWILTGIHRASGTVIPRGDTILRPGDLLYSVGPTESIKEYLRSIGIESEPTRRVVIGGAGQVGEWLAKRLVKEKIQVVVIQRGVSRAFNLAAEVPEALVLRGDAMRAKPSPLWGARPSAAARTASSHVASRSSPSRRTRGLVRRRLSFT